MNRLPPSPLPTVRPTRPPQSALPSSRTIELAHPSSPVARIGQQIRALRAAAGLSAGGLARAASISPSLLSRVERGLASPSVDTLTQISQALDVPVSRFFGDQALRADFSFVPAGKGIQVGRHGAVAGYNYELLGHQLSGNLFVEPYLVTLAPDAGPYVTFQHPGIKFIYWLTGEAVYRYGTKTLTVRPGDSMVFDATSLHGIDEIVSRPVSYLSVVASLRG